MMIQQISIIIIAFSQVFQSLKFSEAPLCFRELDVFSWMLGPHGLGLDSHWEHMKAKCNLIEMGMFLQDLLSQEMCVFYRFRGKTIREKARMGLFTVLYKSPWEKWRNSSINRLVMNAELSGTEKTPERETHVPSVRDVQSWEFLNPEKETVLTTPSHVIYTFLCSGVPMTSLLWHI